MNAASPMPVTVIGGYLGAGKTTMLNHLLRTSGERVAVIVNDFGETVIDADLVESHDGDTLSLANGCICCTLADGFDAALRTVTERELRPERLIIEASGVADPAQVAAYAHGPGLTLDGVLVVVDTTTISRQSSDRLVGDVVRGQLQAADLLVATHGDEGPPAAAGRVWLAEQADLTAPVIDAPHGRLPLDVAFGAAPRRDLRVGGAGHDHGHDHDHGHAQGAAYHSLRFRSWLIEHAGPVDRAWIEETLRALPPDVARVKGVAHLADGTAVVVQRVGPRSTVTPHRPPTDPSPTEPSPPRPHTRLLVIAPVANPGFGT